MIRLKRLVRRGFCSGKSKGSASSIDSYGVSAKMGGSSKDGLFELYEGKFDNQAIENFKRLYKKYENSKDPQEKYRNQEIIPGTTIITNRDECLYCVEKLRKTKTIVAWDTQTIDLDIKNESPVGNGKIIAASFFAGPQYNFGNGPRVFIDNFGKNAGLINHFKEYLQSEEYKKVWHNYGFDRHIFYNHGINVRGFGGDTMHMARLLDSAKMPGSYSLAALTKEYNANILKVKAQTLKKTNKAILKCLSSSKEKDIQHYRAMKNNIQEYEKYHEFSTTKKTKMDEKFRRKRRLRNGTEGKTYEFPSLLTVHTSEQYIKSWIQYSVLDSESTYYLRETLEALLKLQKSVEYEGLKDVWTIYEKYWLPFGEVLTDMERNGFRVNPDHILSIESAAQSMLEEKKKKFIDHLKKFQRGKNVQLFNPSSNQQLQQLIYAPYKPNTNNQKPKAKKQEYAYQTDYEDLLQNAESESKAYEVSARKLPDLQEKIKTFSVQNPDPNRTRKNIEMEIEGLGIPAQKFTPQNLPAVDEAILNILSGKPSEGRFGKALDFFQTKNQEELGKHFCFTLQTLLEYKSIETLLKTFISPLKDYPDANNRVHCSLNINTETGRLSARKPNLQNQPALDKDIYRIRQAFEAEKGNKLIVADYGQLELRVLAHLTDCKTMIEAFKLGGDFHSRTAMTMYPHIKEQVEQGKVLLEWDKSKGEPPVPLLKEKYSAERKKAKTVNFSIAYGKSAKGFAADWNCSEAEAKNVIKAWFAERPEVENWQKNKQQIAQRKHYTQTLMGRFRNLEKFFKTRSKSMYGMWQRRSINTPIQGGAADIVIAAMVKIHYDKELRQLGWKLLMQIHDQLILQGPEQTAERALEIVKHGMAHPLEKDLRVELEIDAKIGDNWYECK